MVPYFGEDRNTKKPAKRKTSANNMPPKQRIRQRFDPNQDYLLAVQVNTDLPFCAPYGGLMAGWDKIATTLNDTSAFKMHHLKGPIAKNRFERLVARYRDWVNNCHLAGAPPQDTSFQRVMAEVVPKLDAAEREPQVQKLGKRGRPRKMRRDDGEVPFEKKSSDGSSQSFIAPFPAAPHQLSTSLSTENENKALSVVAKATRQRFTPTDDLLLVKLVKEALPFRAKFGAISAAWDDVATKLDSSPDFSKDTIKGPIVRYRFENLVAKYRERAKRNDGRVVGSEGVPAAELDVLLTELVMLLDGGDVDSTALVPQNLAIATGAESLVAPRASTGQDGDFCSSEMSSPHPTSSGTTLSAIPSSIITSMESKPSEATILLPKNAALLNGNGNESSSYTDTTSIAELKTLLQKLVEQQSQTTDRILLLQRKERRLEAEWRDREMEREREERKKDRQVLTEAVVSVMKMYFEQSTNKDSS